MCVEKTSYGVDQIGDYKVVKTLGEGGYGVVYLCEDLRLRRKVAVKLLKQAGASERVRARFQREAEILARLRHPNIVTVHNVGEHLGSPYLVLDYLEGQNLQERLDSGGPLPIRDAVELMAGVADAIAYCHEQNVLHRDLKPENIIVSGGKPVVTDFGLSKVESSGTGLTAPGSGLGTLGFLPPEQLENASCVSPAADIFALGGTLYALLAGWKPFPGSTLREIVLSTMKGQPTPIRQLRPEAPAVLDAMCLRCLQRLPENRYPSAAALRDDLRKFLRGEPIAIPDQPPPDALSVATPASPAGLLDDVMDDTALEPPPPGSDAALTVYYEHARKGAAFAKKKSFAAARDEFAAALAAKPNDLEVRLQLALAKRKTFDSIGSIADYSAVLKASPKEPRAFVGRGAAKTDLKDFSGAVADFERALELYSHAHPRAPRIRKALESARARLGDTVIRRGRLVDP